MLDQQVDDKGTDQAKGQEIIRNLRDRAFGASDDNSPSHWDDRLSMFRQ